MPATYPFNPADFEPIRRVALQYPGTEDGMSHNSTPSIKIGKKLMCRLHENGEIIPIHLTFETRDAFLETYPESFTLPEHFKPWPYIALIVGSYTQELLKEVLESSWRVLATKKHLAEWAGR